MGRVLGIPVGNTPGLKPLALPSVHSFLRSPGPEQALAQKRGATRGNCLAVSLLLTRGSRGREAAQGWDLQASHGGHWAHGTCTRVSSVGGPSTRQVLRCHPAKGPARARLVLHAAPRAGGGQTDVEAPSPRAERGPRHPKPHAGVSGVMAVWSAGAASATQSVP